MIKNVRKVGNKKNKNEAKKTHGERGAQPSVEGGRRVRGRRDVFELKHARHLICQNFPLDMHVHTYTFIISLFIECWSLLRGK